jgi:hypothetical protein
MLRAPASQAGNTCASNRRATVAPDSGAAQALVGNQTLLRAITLPLRPSRMPVLQRKCACGESAITGGCPECRANGQPRVSGAVRTKLQVSQPGDALEREADSVAANIMRMWDSSAQGAPEQGYSHTALGSGEGRLLRQDIEEEQAPVGPGVSSLDEDAGGGSESDDDTDEDEDNETGMPKRQAGADTSQRVQNVDIPSGPGAALAPTIRGAMERSFDHDFGDVRVHTDSPSVQSARQLHAHAYTVGNHVYFNSGQYAPDTRAGQHLLAHELTHVVQSSSGTAAPRRVQRQEIEPDADPEKAGPGTGGGKTKGKAAPAKGGGSVCGAGGCPQGKQSKTVHDDCATSDAADKTNFITDLNVSLSKRNVEIVWSGGTTQTIPCSPRPGVTPKGPDLVGLKCSVNHTNLPKKKGAKPDGMAWFTGFQSQGFRIGFHDSQKVGASFNSHGCVRVCCDKAEMINKNSTSGKTRISVT